MGPRRRLTGYDREGILCASSQNSPAGNTVLTIFGRSSSRNSSNAQAPAKVDLMNCSPNTVEVLRESPPIPIRR